MTNKGKTFTITNWHDFVEFSEAKKSFNKRKIAVFVILKLFPQKLIKDVLLNNFSLFATIPAVTYQSQ